MSDMVARDLMTWAPATVPVSATVREAVELLRSLDVRHLPVVNEDRELVGMLSDRDLRGLPIAEPGGGEVLARPPDLEAPVATVMTGGPISVETDADVSEIVELMLENKIGAVPVVDPAGKVLGIVSYIDLLRQLGRALVEMEEEAPKGEEERTT